MITKEELLRKKDILSNAAKQLKKEFVGIDTSIDSIISMIESWYILPDTQLRPTVIPVFGLTGTGKSSLVRRLFDLLELPICPYFFDMGSYMSDSTYMSLKNALSTAIETSEDSHILVFDEFQLSRTINEQGLEVDKSSARVIWDAIDNGMIELYKKSSTTRDLIQCNQYVIEFLDKRIRTKNNHVIDEDMQITKTLVSNVWGNRENIDIETYRYIIPRNYFYVFSEHEFIKYEGEFYFKSYEKLINKTEKMSRKELLDWFDKFLDLHFKPQIIDLKKSLIFILGNLDEAYGISGDINPDADADLYHEHTLSITNSKIKDALLTRFRPEQVSRLGNNYVIYPSLNKKSYQKLIKMHLNRVKKMCKKEFEMNIIFDKSIEEIIYKESVFPTQGARPVMSSISSMIESYIPRIIKDSIVDDFNNIDILWSYKEDNYRFVFVKNDKVLKTYTYPIILKIEKERVCTFDDEQAITAVHEAGHAVVAAKLLQICPLEVVSRTASVSQGFCRIRLPKNRTKKIYEHDIAMCFGGIIAERLIFGKDYVSEGASSDMATATKKANLMFKSLGMFEDSAYLIGPKDSTFHNNTHLLTDEAEDKIKNLLQEQYSAAENALKSEIKLLVKLSDHLNNNSKIEQKELTIMIEQYSHIKLKDVDNYHDFRGALNNEIKKQNCVPTKRIIVKTKKKVVKTVNL